MRQRCRAREDFILHENAMKRQNQTLATENATLNAKVNTLTSEKETINNEFASAKKAWDIEREQLLAKLAEYEAKDNKE